MTAHPHNLFDTLWREVSEDHAITVQDRTELEYIFNLIRGCKSYLEIGTAEGKSLYVLAHALDPEAEITFVDYGEAHTKERRDHYLAKIRQKVTSIFGDSTKGETIAKVEGNRFEVVLIDAGHDTFSVMNDATHYGHLATRYLLFHDVQMPEVANVFSWYAQNTMSGKRAYKVVNSENFGYGIIEI